MRVLWAATPEWMEPVLITKTKRGTQTSLSFKKKCTIAPSIAFHCEPNPHDAGCGCPCTTPVDTLVHSFLQVVAFVQQCRHEVDDARAARLLQQNGLASDSDNEDGTSSESMQNYAIVTAALVDEALQKGSSDNVSCVIVHFQNGLATVSS